MKRRILTVAIALVLAIFGTLGVLAYVHQANNRALAGQKAVSVLVAGGLIQAGTSAGTAESEGLLKTQQFPAKSVPVDAVRSITPALSALVMSADIQPGQLLLRPMLVTSTQAASTLAIPKGMVAVTIALCLPESVAGYVTAGSQVAIFDTYGAGSLAGGQDCSGSHSQSTSHNVGTRVVLPKVTVLAVGSAAANATAQNSSSGVFNKNSNSSAQSSQGAVLVTLAVDQADAERVILLNETGLPYLALLTSSSNTGFDHAVVSLFQP